MDVIWILTCRGDVSYVHNLYNTDDPDRLLYQIDPKLTLCDTVLKLYSTDPTQETCVC